MKKLILLSTMAGMAMAATGCGHYCKRARTEILAPTQTVMTYLSTNPSGQDLETSGCGLILAQLANIPDGAAVIRHLAEARFTHTNSYCLNWQTATRMHCDYYKDFHGDFHPGHGGGEFHPGHGGGDFHPGHDGDHDGHGGYHPGPGYPYNPHPHCYPETYTYCGQWQYDTIHEPGYAAAVQLSTDLDKMYAQAHQVCGEATTGSVDQAYNDSRQFLNYLQNQVKPEGDSVYAQACN